MAAIIVDPSQAGGQVDIVCGNANAEVIRFTFDKEIDGVDLSEYAWSVTVKNSGGFSDVYMQGVEGSGLSSTTVGDDSISIDWMLRGVALGKAGRTLYQLAGSKNGAVKRFPYRTINVLSYLASDLSSEAEDDNSALHETIEYVSTELPGILEAEEARVAAETARALAEEAREAAETARKAAEEAREAAEAARASGFAKIDLTVSKTGRETTVTAVNAQGEESTAKVLDGKDGAGSGDMSKRTYDTDNDGVVEVADRAANMPLPSVANAGKTIIVGADGSYTLGEAGSKDAVLYTAQSLTTEQKAQARANIGVSEAAVLYTAQTLSDAQKTQARTNIGVSEDAVLYTEQTLTEEQKTQARTNIDAANSDHTQAAGTISAGTFAGDVKAPATTDMATPILRNSVITNTDPGAGASSSYPAGTEISVYE